MKIKFVDMVSNWSYWAPGKHVPRVGEFVTIRNGARLLKAKVLFVEYCYVTIMDDPAELTNVKITLEWLPS